ncbi:MAG TPA: methyltransferase domain-containing protein [Rhizomicrobium sp.]|jgi:protein-L-isoaspartate(D-aspartate) O-methyltransferase
MTGTIEEARSWFAEDLRVAAGIKSSEVISAFARVPRENYIGPSPWRLGMRVSGVGAKPYSYQTFEGDPRALYHDVIVALDEEKEVNNGQPSLWAKMFDEIDLRPGETILHLGCGTGYYTAVMAEIVGAAGSIAAVEIDEPLARRARDALSGNTRISVAVGNGTNIGPEAYDAIVISAGATHPLECWLDGLKTGGRLLFPLTVELPQARSGSGAMLLITRTMEGSFAARFVGPAAFIHFQGARNNEANQTLLEALRLRHHQISEVRTLRRESHKPDESCWLHGEKFCLSRRELAA